MSYQIICDSYILHDTRVEELKVLNPKCSLKLNTSGELSFDVLPNHPYYNAFNKLKSEISLFQDGLWLFSGRVLNDEKDMSNIKHIQCEGELSYLLDSNQRVAEYHDISVEDYFTTLINNHNLMVESAKQFTVGSVTVTDPNDSLYRFSNYENTWNSIQDKLVDRLGGYIRTQHSDNGNKIIDYVEDYENINSQTIDFGKNLLTLKRTSKGENIATAIIPLGAKIETEDENGNESEIEERLTISEVNNGIDYVFDQQAVDLYGWIYDTVVFDDVTIAGNLLTKGQQELQRRILLDINLELTAIDLHLLDVNIEKIKLGDKIRVISPPHNIDEFMLVSAISIDIANPSNTVINLGSTQRALTDVTNKDKIGEVIEKVINDTGINQDLTAIKNSVNEVYSSMLQTATQILLQVASNYITKDQFNDYSEYLSSTVEMLNNLIEFRFTTATGQTQSLEGVVEGNRLLIEEYIRFEGARITLGRVDSPFKAVFTNERLSFFQDNVEIAYISNNKLYITDVEIKNMLTIGNPDNGYFDFIPRSNGNLTMKWRA
jgi:phage minor structural protein